MKTAVIAIGRRENEYAREFVEHHLSVGFDKIIIADNNHDKEERFEDVLSDYIADGKVTVEDYRNQVAVQCQAYNALYKKYGKTYDWIAFFDFDEQLVLKGKRTLKDWLAGFEPETDAVLVNWKCMTDGGMLESDGRPLKKRFTKAMPSDRILKRNTPENNHVKCIVRGGLPDVRFIKQPHVPETCSHCHTANGKPCENSPFQPYDYSVATLMHYTTKTIGEWLRNKWQKGVAVYDDELFKKRYSRYFYGINEETEEKKKYAEAFERNRANRLTAVIIHYNTPEVTEACIRSLWKHTPGVYVIVFDNSDKEPFTKQMANVEVIDNTKGQIINFGEWLDTFPNKEPSPGNDYGSAKHCYSVQWIIDHRRNPFILIDGDVLIKQDIAPLWDKSQAFVGHIGCNTRRFGFVLNRVEPWLCFINVRMMRQNGIGYFNPNKMWNLVSKAPDDHYDTGAYFLEECNRLRLPYREIENTDYGLHMRHGSWRKKNQLEWLKENKALWQW